jgi:hypothetical protein
MYRLRDRGRRALRVLRGHRPAEAGLRRPPEARGRPWPPGRQRPGGNPPAARPFSSVRSYPFNGEGAAELGSIAEPNNNPPESPGPGPRGSGLLDPWHAVVRRPAYGVWTSLPPFE